ncbi:hypothetical protein G9A89_008516 [Geosiphon pyriformis]|nr:hypothetical protein G9A89_008516 [Geosiphon pyriformis]
MKPPHYCGITNKRLAWLHVNKKKNIWVNFSVSPFTLNLPMCLYFLLAFSSNLLAVIREKSAALLCGAVFFDVLAILKGVSSPLLVFTLPNGLLVVSNLNRGVIGLAVSTVNEFCELVLMSSSPAVEVMFFFTWYLLSIVSTLQQTVAIAMVTLNPFVVSDEILGKISITATSPLPDMNSNSNGSTPNTKQDQPLVVLPDVVISGRSSPATEAKQPIILDDLKDWADQMEMESSTPPPVSGRFSGWVASTLVPGATFKIKMALLSSLFQLLPGCIGLKSVSRNAVKLFCVEFASQESLTGITKVAIGNEIFLTTLKIAQSSGVVSVSSPSLSVTLHDVPLGISSNDIKTALGIFGVVTSQYAVVNFKNTSSATTALSHWSVLVRKDSVRILPIANQKKIIFSRDAFKAKLVNLPFGCTAFEISDLVSQVGGCTCFIPHSPDFY